MATNFPQAVREAIYDYASGSAFLIALTGGLHYGRAPQCAPGTGGDIQPYAVFSLPVLAEKDTFTETLHNGLVQFRIFTTDTLTCERILHDCQTLYDSGGKYDCKWIEPDATYCAGFIMTRNNFVLPYPSTKDPYYNWEGMVDFNILLDQK